MTTPVRTTAQALARAHERFDSAEAIVDGTVRIGFAELHERVRRLAGFLVAEGIRPGDRVAVWSPNTWHWVVAALGAQYAGATLVPINTRFTGHEALDILARTEAAALVVTGWFLGADRLAALREAAAEHDVTLPRLVVRVPVETAEPAAEGVLEWADADGDPIEPRAEAEACSDILFTSGTSGRSKGAMSAHRQAVDVARAWAERAELTAEDRYLAINPFFHSFGYKAGILPCLLHGSCLYPQAAFDARRTLELVHTERISVLPGAPTIYHSLLEGHDGFDLSSLRLAVTGAATVPIRLIERMRDELGFRHVLTAYGLTEAVVATMCSLDDPPETVSGTAGRAVAGFEVRIGEQNEICLRGPNVMLGYFGDDAATAAAIDVDGWLHTGDVGQLDAEGNLSVTDRLKDMYISGGFNVYPAEVEQELSRLDGVREAAVIGVPDDRLGQVGVAYVVADAGLTEAKVHEHCRARLANYKVPRFVRFVDTLPRNASGKVLKRVLRSEQEATR